jgi:outer membrane protein OmpA-like peptidoglycan-associated protein
VKQLEDRARGTVLVEGHTDAKGSAAYNLRLSEGRARAVHKVLTNLVSKPGLTFQVRGFGESRPVAANTTRVGDDNPKGRALNRRVEVRFDKA